MTTKEEFPFPHALEYMLRLCGENIELMKYVSQVIGYGMGDVKTEKIIPIFYGPGCKGLFDMLERILNNYYVQIHEEIVSKPSRGHSLLIGPRFGVFKTNEPQKYLKGLRILNSSDPIKFKKTTFTPTCKVFVTTETRPDFEPEDGVIFIPLSDAKPLEYDHLSELASFFLMGANDWHQNGFMEFV